MTLAEKQFELGGVAFGRGCPVEIESWTPGSASIRTSDAENPQGDGIRFGRDFRGASEWSWSLFSNGETEEEAWEFLHPLAGEWNDDAIRADSEIVVPLRYTLAGQTKRVYGRPRRWTEIPTNISLSGAVQVEADFTLAHHLVYDDTEKSLNLSILPPLDPEAGVIVPFIAPFDSAASASERQSAIRVGGTRPTPITVKFVAGTNDLFDASVTIGDWTVALESPVDINDPVIADGRPWINSVATQSGGTVRVSPRVTRTSKMWLPPGDHQVVFRGNDPSSTASVVISWHDALDTLR